MCVSLLYFRLTKTPQNIAIGENEAMELSNLEFGMRDYMSVVRAKSAHPLGRKTHSASRIGLHTGLDKSMEKSTNSILHSSFTVVHDNKYERSQVLKDKKERLESFTNKKIHNAQAEKNREWLEGLNDKLEQYKNDPARLERKEKAEMDREERRKRQERIEKRAHDKIYSRIKDWKKSAHNHYLERFPPISNDVKELREKEHKEKYMTDKPLHQRLLEDFEEREARRLKEVKDQLHQLKVQPIDFVVAWP